MESREMVPFRGHEGQDQVMLPLGKHKGAERSLALEFVPNSDLLNVAFASALGEADGCSEFRTSITEGIFSFTLAGDVLVAGSWRSQVLFVEVRTHSFSNVICMYRVRSGDLEGWAARAALRVDGAS